jgi:hypothetical protein
MSRRPRPMVSVPQRRRSAKDDGVDPNHRRAGRHEGLDQPEQQSARDRGRRQRGRTPPASRATGRSTGPGADIGRKSPRAVGLNGAFRMSP